MTKTSIHEVVAAARPVRDPKSEAQDPRGAVISEVEPRSIAHRVGLKPGDSLLRVNGPILRDAIQFLKAEAEELVRFDVLSREGDYRAVEIEKDPGEPLGLSFTTSVFDGIRRCNNRCTFCFVSRLPKRLRRSLYVRDDDYRLSFLHGNFVTLTNLTEGDFRRIAGERLSPLYVSVHATDDTVRRWLLGNPSAPAILPTLRRLAEADIEFHAQVVICAGVNDGRALTRTVCDLAKLRPHAASVAIVPVGLTKYEPRGNAIRPVTKDLARRVLAQIERLRARCRAHSGSSFVYAADELWQLGRLPFPPADYYDDFPQIENGIGMARSFLEELEQVRGMRRLRARLQHVTLVTGEAARDMVRQLGDWLQEAARVQTNVVIVTNRLLGERVTCAGLLSGQDVLAALEGQALGQAVFLPGTCVNEDGLLLDDWSVAELAAKLNVPVLASASSPLSLVKALGTRA